MTHTHEGRSGGCNGENALTRGLRSRPRSTGAHFGCEGFRICNWSTEVEEYQLPAVPEWIVALHTGGASVDRIGAGRLHGSRSTPGLGTIRPPGVSDTYRPRGPFRCTTAHVSAHKVQAIAEGMGLPRLPDAVPYRFGVQDVLVSSILSALSREIEAPAQHGSLLADRLIESLVIAILRIPRPDLPPGTAPRLGAGALARVRERIEEWIARPIAVADLAAEAGLSPFHFARAFKHSTGTTPHRYVTERRIERAKALLLDGDLPICRVALESGFTSQQHFTGQFRRFAGAPPARYRRLHRPGSVCPT
jgi:AraC family transcriptional regulator